MAKRALKTVKEVLFWSYANLAMAHTAVDKKQAHYVTVNYMIRSKLFKGLMDGSMNIRTIFDDEKIKLIAEKKCSYCGTVGDLTLDHLLPQKLGGKDVGDNLIYACRSCNSSKGRKDFMEWMAYKNSFPPLMILRRYLKLIISYCIKENLMECAVVELKKHLLPFSIERVPLRYPQIAIIRRPTHGTRRQPPTLKSSGVVVWVRLLKKGLGRLF